MRVRALPLALATFGFATGCHRPPAVRRVAYSYTPIVTELTPPPCGLSALPATLERRLATSADAVSPAATRLVVRVLSADSGLGIARAVVGVDSRRATPMPDPGLFRLDSLAPGPHDVRVRALGFLPLNDSLLVRTGYADTLVVRLALWCR
jgi:hypothetical protein